MVNALIIGGGISGPLTALALQKSGIDSVVHEAHPNGSEGLGAFLTVATNGIDALTAIGAEHTVLDQGFPTTKMAMFSASGRALGTVSAASTRPGSPAGRTMRRSDLYRSIRDEALSRGIPIEYGRRLVSAEPTATGVRAIFEDGSTATGDLLIGCDGIHSTVRRLIDPRAPEPTHTGITGSGGYSDGIPVTTAPDTTDFVFGKRGFFGYTPAPDGEVWWFANLPVRTEPAYRGGDLRDWLAPIYAADTGPAAQLITAGRDLMPLTDIYYLPHLPHWHTDRMIVIGDAAHAPSGSSGQGASLAMEDAVVLARCLRDLPLPNAFQHYEALRRPRVEEIIKRAARVNRNKAAGPVGRAFMALFMPLVLPRMGGSKAMRRTYDHHIDWEETVSASTVRT